jgi:RNA polymerase-binding protein
MLRQITSLPNTRDIFSYQPIRGNDDVAARQSAVFLCPRGHEFVVMFADDAVPPAQWECRHHSVKAATKGVPHQPQPRPRKTHWDLLRERRTEPELAALLTEQIEALRSGRSVPVGAQ